jgi:formate dehydrogenase major subunit
VSVGELFRSWPLVRQLLDRDPTALGATAATRRTLELAPRTAGAIQVDGVCPYCATGCALTVSVADGRIVDIEGDERSPVSRGRLCPKGQATFQFVTGSHRLDRVLYRRPGGTEWEHLTLDEAMDMVADRFLETRDATWEDADDQGRPLNRTLGIGVVGGATLDNEESYVMRKLLTAAGVVQMDNQARICHSPTPAGLGATWGRGGATGYLADLANADVILIMGSNMAETHVVGFQWVMEAKERGATVIHVDPRFTRTSAQADVYAQIRPGSDLVFLGALVNHVLSGGHEFRDFVVAYTNASTLVSEDFVDTEDLDGIFSGWDPVAGEYDPTSWAYDHGPEGPADGGPTHPSALVNDGSSTARHDGALTDPTLTHPRSVFQVLRRHFSRYTPEMVEQTCGIPAESFGRIADELVANSGPERTGYVCYAVGWTMHMHGAQLIRTAAILQTLLGNVGRPGGGIMALRGHSNVQGTTDVSTLYETLPAYLAMPTAEDTTLDAYLERHTAHVGLFGSYREYLVSQMRAWFGERATEESEWGFGWLPRLTGDASYEATMVAAADGAVDGYLVMGQNPVVGAMNAALQRKAYRAMKWVVVRDLALIETAEFWRNAPEIKRGEVRTEDIDTEVFVFPAAAITEKSGSLTNTQRLLQWHDKAVDPPGDATSDLWWCHDLGRRLRERAARRNDPKDAPLLALAWDYRSPGVDEDPDPRRVLAEMNGVDADGVPLTSSAQLRGDGSISCGMWIYAGVLDAAGTNRAARRPDLSPDDPLALGWGWTWPANRHVLYNRCSARPDGTPWSERKKLVWWDPDADAGTGRWVGLDVPDFPLGLAPGTPADPDGLDAMGRLGADDPFLGKSDGKAWLYAPSGLRDGPLPVHYEPLEGGVANPLHRQQRNPARTVWDRDDNPYHRPVDDRFPYVLTTNRLTEMYGAGVMSRWLPWLAELQPAGFLELSPALAAELGVHNGGWVTVTTARAEIEVRALVTERLATLRVHGGDFHHVALNYHFGRKGLVTGDVTNELVAFAGEPNTTIQGSKVLSVALTEGRRVRGRQAATSGPFPAPVADLNEGDLPGVGPRGAGPHGFRGGRSRAGGTSDRGDRR